MCHRKCNERDDGRRHTTSYCNRRRLRPPSWAFASGPHRTARVVGGLKTGTTGSSDRMASAAALTALCLVPAPPPNSEATVARQALVQFRCGRDCGLRVRLSLRHIMTLSPIYTTSYLEATMSEPSLVPTFGSFENSLLYRRTSPPSSANRLRGL